MSEGLAVTAVETSAYTVPLEVPESDGTLTWDHTTVVTTHVYGGGARGLGFTYGPTACRAVIHDELRPVVLGRDAFDIPGAWQAMVGAIRNAGRPGVCSMAIAAVDVALWDLKAKLLGQSLVSLLGAARPEVPAYGSGGFTSMPVPALVEQLAGWVAAGFPRVKMKVGAEWGACPARDLARTETVRAAIGDEPELFVDANGGYTVKQAASLARRWEELGVTWFEEPVSSDDLTGLNQVRQRTSIHVAAGEYGYDLPYFERMCAAGAVDILQADASRCAGISEWLRVAGLAAAHGLRISGHCAPSLHAHVAAAVPNLAHVEYFADHAHADHLLFDGVLDPVGGCLRPDRTRPGLGLELKAADAARYAT